MFFKNLYLPAFKFIRFSRLKNRDALFMLSNKLFHLEVGELPVKMY
jgi:hypothetical protein